MNLFSESSTLDKGNSILLSVKPTFSNLIIDGSKRVEFRRIAPAQRVTTIAIYATSPVKAIVALVDVSETIKASPEHLWSIAKKNGGGLTKVALLNYFEAKNLGYALMLGNVRVFAKPVLPIKIFETFTAPQSFRYITQKDLKKLERILETEKR